MHLSIGFVIEASPRRPVYSGCAQYAYQYNQESLLLDRTEQMAIWPRENGDYCWNYGECAPRGSFCIPRGDSAYLVFSVYDTDGDEFDISGASEIVFAIADDDTGGQVRVVKRLTDTEIQISTNMYQFMVTLDSVDTESLAKVHNYYEARITTSSGLQKTVSSGLFKSTDTVIKDIL